jgi:hypothetical protein
MVDRTLIDGRPEIIEEVKLTQNEVRDYLSQQFVGLLQNRLFLEALPGHILPDAASQQRVPILMERIRSLANLS